MDKTGGLITDKRTSRPDSEAGGSLSEYVFDTEAIIAFLYEEPGDGLVADLLGGAFSSEAERLPEATNASEVFYLVATFEGTGGSSATASLRDADRDIQALERQGLELEAADWRLAAEVKADGRISLADAYAVGLAYERDATLVADADDEFNSLPVDVEVRRFREEGA